MIHGQWFLQYSPSLQLGLEVLLAGLLLGAVALVAKRHWVVVSTVSLLALWASVHAVTAPPASRGGWRLVSSQAMYAWPGLAFRPEVLRLKITSHPANLGAVWGAEGVGLPVDPFGQVLVTR